MKRVLFFLFCFLCAFSSIAIADEMRITVCPPDEWSYVTIYHEEEVSTEIQNVVLFLHGDGHTNGYQTPQESIIDALGSGYGPVFYEIWGKMTLPQQVVIICPQAHPDGDTSSDFLTKQDQLHDFCQEIRESYPKANLTVVGHSQGAYATYAFCLAYPDDADQWVFLSGTQVGKEQLPSHIRVLVAATNQETDLFPPFRTFFSTNFSFEEENVLKEDTETGNAYAVLTCTHAETPMTMLMPSFWEWVML